MAVLNVNQESVTVGQTPHIGNYADYLQARGYRREIWDWNVGEKNFEAWSPTYVKPRRVWDELSSHEKPILIFAPRGVGKSALRVMMQNHLDKRGYFIIEHITMDSILAKGAAGTSSDGLIPVSAHLEAIAEQATIKLVGRVVEQDRPPDLSQQTRQWLCALWNLYENKDIVSGWDEAKRHRWNRFVGLRRNMRRFVDRAKTWVGKGLRRSSGGTTIGSVLQVLGALMESSNEDQNAKLLLRRLADIVADFGYKKIVIAVNGLDEHPDTHDLRSIQNINRILSPLLSNQQLLEIDRYVWRIFVPWHAKGAEAIRAFRGSAIDPRNERMDLEWSHEEMLCILGSRLLAFRNDVRDEARQPIEAIDAARAEVKRYLGTEIANSSCMSDIISMAHCNPRRLFELMKRITLLFCYEQATTEAIRGVIYLWTDSVYDELPTPEKRILERYRSTRKKTLTAGELETLDPDADSDLQSLVVKNQLQSKVGKYRLKTGTLLSTQPCCDGWTGRP